MKRQLRVWSFAILPFARTERAFRVAREPGVAKPDISSPEAFKRTSTSRRPTGVLPVFNREAARMAVKFGLAIGATVNEHSVFARKNYFYPSLSKGYQISQ